jgi:hypothetical protein
MPITFDVMELNDKSPISLMQPDLHGIRARIAPPPGR